jgi:hypothetical protein
VLQDRDAARDRIAGAGLTQLAVECVARNSFRRMPITLIDRARTQLHRLFSEGPWTEEDDAGRAVLVGGGEGWDQEELQPGLRLSFGWQAHTFRVDIDAEALDPDREGRSPTPTHERTLGDTFEQYMLVEAGRTPAELRFAVLARSGVPAVSRATTKERRQRSPRCFATSTTSSRCGWNPGRWRSRF